MWQYGLVGGYGMFLKAVFSMITIHCRFSMPVPGLTPWVLR